MRALSRAAVAAGRRLPRGYSRMLRAASNRDPELQDFELVTTTESLVLRGDLRESVYYGILREGCIPHQRGLDRVLRLALREGESVVDVGANVGYTALLAATLVGRTGKVLAIEPSPRMFALLCRSAEAYPQVEAVRLALGDAENRTWIYERQFGDLSSLQPSDDAVAQPVEVTTADALLAGRPCPAFVKIDVEGFEPAVLRGMRQLVSSPRPPIIVFEALSRAALDECLAILSIRSEYSAFARIGASKISRELDDSSLSCDFIAVPEWAEDRVRPVWAG